MPAISSTIEEVSEREDISFQKRYRDLVDNIEAIVWEADAEMQLSFISPQVEEWLGYTTDECLQEAEAWKKLLHPDDFERVVRDCGLHAQAGEDHQLDFRLVAKDGRVLWVRGLVSVEMSGGRPTRLHGILLDITEQKKSEVLLREREQRFRAVFESAFDAMLIADDEGRLVQINPAGYALLRLTENDGNKLFDLFPPADRRTAKQEWRRILQAGQRKGDYRKRWDGDFCDIAYTVCAHFLPHRHLIVLTDITERRQAEEVQRVEQSTLERDHAILQATLEAVADGICLVDDNGEVVSVNARFAALWQLSVDALETLLRENGVMAHVLSRLQDPDEFIQKIHFLFDNPRASTRDQVRLLDGRTFERHSAPAQSPQGFSYGRVWSWTDVTERRRHEEELAYQAFHDAVTGLPNRALFLDRLRHALDAINRSHAGVGVLFLDLDRFKMVNDSLGHEVGDRLLKQVAERLSACLRPGDTAARFGGDEFTLLLEQIRGTADATAVSERVLAALSEPFHLDQHQVHIAASIGVVLTETANEDPEELLRRADVAMYQAKSEGKAQYKIFDARMSELAIERLQMDIALRKAVQEQQFQLFYHPLFDLETRRITGVEALLRWRHPQRGLLNAPEFLEIAEENGLIVPIGAWVLKEACEQLCRWRQSGRAGETLQISVNLSARQFLQENLVDDVKRVLLDTQIPPGALNLEISESAVMADAPATSRQLGALKKLGVQLSLDDFGTGYSSLSHLEEFPLDRLKIDQIFVARIGSQTAGDPQRDSQAIVRAVCELAQSLGMEVMAEGIETRAQLEHLRAMGCRIGQGYYFTQPLDAAAFEELLAKESVLEAA